MDLTTIIENVKDFDRNIDTILVDLVARTQDRTVREMNENQMFIDGQDAEGRAIVPAYAASTIERKKKKGQPYDRVTLRDTRDFHNSILVEYRADEFQLDADDFKTPYLADRYGYEILGLTPNNVQILSDRLRPILAREFQKSILK